MIEPQNSVEHDFVTISKAPKLPPPGPEVSRKAMSAMNGTGVKNKVLKPLQAMKPKVAAAAASPAAGKVMNMGTKTLTAARNTTTGQRVAGAAGVGAVGAWAGGNAAMRRRQRQGGVAKNLEIWKASPQRKRDRRNAIGGAAAGAGTGAGIGGYALWQTANDFGTTPKGLFAADPKLKPFVRKHTGRLALLGSGVGAGYAVGMGRMNQRNIRSARARAAAKKRDS